MTTLIKKDWQQRLAAIKKGPPTQPGAEAEITAIHRSNPLVDQASQSFDSPDALPQPTRPAAAAGAPPSGDGTVQPSPAGDHNGNSGGDVKVMVLDRLEKLERHQRHQRFLSVAILGMLGVFLAAQVFLLVRPQPLDLRDQTAKLRIWGPGPKGSFALSPDD